MNVPKPEPRCEMNAHSALTTPNSAAACVVHNHLSILCITTRVYLYPRLRLMPRDSCHGCWSCAVVCACFSFCLGPGLVYANWTMVMGRDSSRVGSPCLRLICLCGGGRRSDGVVRSQRKPGLRASLSARLYYTCISSTMRCELASYHLAGSWPVLRPGSAACHRRNPPSVVSPEVALVSCMYDICTTSANHLGEILSHVVNQHKSTAIFTDAK